MSITRKDVDAILAEETAKQKCQVEAFCDAARKFGFVIDPTDVALELTATADEMRQGAKALALHAEALRIGAELEWVA